MQENQMPMSMGDSYQQFLEQQHRREEQAAAQAQQAIVSAGLDSFSQQVMNTVQRLRQISIDLGNAQKQLQAQMDAQQRQIQHMQQNIENVCIQLQSSVRTGRAALMQ